MSATSIFDDYTEKEAARLLKVAPRTLRAWRKAGKISHFLLPGGRIRYSMDQLIDFRRATRVSATVGVAAREDGGALA